MKTGRKAYTFKGTGAMQEAMEAVMEHWDLDRTSVIKLALYLLSIYTSNVRVQHFSLHELVEDLEGKAPSGFLPYRNFAN